MSSEFEPDWNDDAEEVWDGGAGPLDNGPDDPRGREFDVDGPPASYLAVEQGDYFVRCEIRKDTLDDELRHVYRIREDLLRERCLPHDALLPLEGAEEVLLRYKNLWQSRDKQKAKFEELLERCSSRQAAFRTRNSNYRTHLYTTFGGRPWVLWFAAIGDLPDVVRHIAQRYWIDRVKAVSGRDASTNHHPAPILSAGRRAMIDGRPVQLTGSQHRLSQGKALRDAARRLDRQVRSAKRDWEAGRSNISWHAWDLLLRRREVWRVVVRSSAVPTDFEHGRTQIAPPITAQGVAVEDFRQALLRVRATSFLSKGPLCHLTSSWPGQSADPSTASPGRLGQCRTGQLCGGLRVHRPRRRAPEHPGRAQRLCRSGARRVLAVVMGGRAGEAARGPTLAARERMGPAAPQGRTGLVVKMTLR